MISDLFQIILWLYSVFIWTTLVLINQLWLLLQYRLSYFQSPKTTKYPDCVKDPKYGISKFIDIETTKGVNMEKIKLKMHYVENGDSEKPKMLFLHGFPEFWYSWRYQLEEFSKTHRVLAIDMRGYGLTDKPSNVEDYQMKHLINDVKGFLDALEIRSVILVAHDWGGGIAWDFEKAYPEMVEKYIALNIPETSAFEKTMNNSWRQFLKSWYMFFFQVPYLPEWVMSRFDMQKIEFVFTSPGHGMQKTKLSKDEINAFKANMAQPDKLQFISGIECQARHQNGALTASINYYRASLRYLSSQEIKSKDKRSEKNRYMLIFGKSDSAISVQCAKETKTFVPNVELRLLPGLSHWVQQDDPVLVNRLIRDFIATG